MSAATEAALAELSAAVERSLDLLDTIQDPTAPEVLAADRVLAAASQRAAAMTAALQA